MILKKCILIANDCYKKGTKITNGKPTGIVVHSTGANNPNLKRYVQPLKTQSDYKAIIADLGTNTSNHWNCSGTGACVHAFIGKTADGTIKTYQTLPFDMCCWGCASGKKGSYNFNPTARVQFEICEDSLKDATYFNKVFTEAIEFCVYLCKLYGFGSDAICSHAESFKLGYGSNHADPDHWLKKFGKDMNWFRSEVDKRLKGTTTVTPTATIKPTVTTQLTTSSTSFSEKDIWNYLYEQIKNPYGVAGLMGNLYVESGLKANNLQNSYEKKLGYTDITYTSAVDSGKYTKFASDSAGYGLCQWTYSSRKANLLAYAKANKASIGDTKMQLGFLMKELTEGYNASVLALLKSAKSVQEASNAVLTKFENPADQSSAVQKQRASYGQGYYDKYAKENSATNNTTTNTSVNKKPANTTVTSSTFKVGDKVKVKSNVTKFYNGVSMASFVKSSVLYVREIEQNGKVLLVSTEPTKKVYTGRVNSTDVNKI